MSKVTPIKPERTMNIRFNYKDTSNKVLHEALDKLDKFTGWQDPEDLWRFNKLKKLFDREHSKAGSWYRKLVHRNAVMVPKKGKGPDGEVVELKDKDGKPQLQPKWAPNAQGQMDIVMKDQEAFERDVKIFHGYEFTVKVYRFKPEDLLAAGLVPSELRACAKMMEPRANYEDLLKDDEPTDAELDDIPEELRAILGDDTDGGDATQESAE